MINKIPYKKQMAQCYAHNAVLIVDNEDYIHKFNAKGRSYEELH